MINFKRLFVMMQKIDFTMNNKVMETTKEQQQNERILGIDRQIVAVVLMSFGSSFITLGFIFANERKFHPVLTCLIRGFSALTVSYFISAYQNKDMSIPSPTKFRWHIIRNSIMTIQGLVYAWSQCYLPLPIVVTLYASTPLFTAVWDYWVFGATINNQQKGWFSLAFFGVILTANGGYLYQVIFGIEKSQFDGYISQDPITTLTFGIILAINQFFHGFGVVSTKKCGKNSTVSVTYFAGLLFFFSSAFLLCVIPKDQHFNWPSLYDFWEGVLFSGLPIVMGMLGFNGALTITHRYGLVAPFQFAAIIVGYVVSLVRYNEPLNWFCASGTVAILVGVIFLLKNKDS